MSPEQQKAWLAQWKHVELELDRVRTEELAAMTEEQALYAADAVLSLATGQPELERRATSGLVMQQRLFGLLRR